MDTYITIALIAAFLAIVVIVAAIIILHVLKRRRANALTSKSALAAGKSLAKDAADTVKKVIAEKPPWLMTPLMVGGGWLFLLFSIYVLLPPSVWQWLLAHSEFFWMPPLATFITQILFTSKKGPAKHLAYAIIFVLAIALVKAIPWSGSGKGDMAPPRPAETAVVRYASISTPLSWAGCEPLPSNIPAKIGVVVSQMLYAPVGVESRCYIIRDGYRSRMASQAPLRMRWQNGTVVNLSPDPTKMTDLGTVWYAAFVISSNGNTPAKLIMRFEKYAQ